MKLQPAFKERIWGGRRLQELFGKSLPEDVKIGESWEIADLAEGHCVIANGELKDMPLGEAVTQFPEAITGMKDFPRPFPLLIKFLDAQDVLSVQVHPDSETCKRMGKGDLKTECWYIMEAAEGAVIYKGLKPGVTKEQFAQAIESGTTAELLEKVKVNIGECHFLPAGTPHAIGAGLLIAEIQTPSDTTYRVFDWNRVDASGQGRQLHVEEALESINFEMEPSQLTVRNVGRLVDCEFFKVDKGHLTKGKQLLLSPGMMQAIIFLSGSGTIENKEIQVDFKAGDSVLIPAAYEGVCKFSKETEYLTVRL